MGLIAKSPVSCQAEIADISIIIMLYFIKLIKDEI